MISHADVRRLLDPTHLELRVCYWYFSKSLLHLFSHHPVFLPLLFVDPSQLPLSHPPAPPEHLKEPLAYMRKAQVSLSALISVTPPSKKNIKLSAPLCTFTFVVFAQICIDIICSLLCFLLSHTGQLGEACPQKPEQHEQRA